MLRLCAKKTFGGISLLLKDKSGAELEYGRTILVFLEYMG